jgi:methionine-rich copper-binding protein CopC
MFPNRHALTRAGTAKFAIVSIAALLSVITSLGSALAHSYSQTMNPAPNARLDSAPAHVGITYDSNIVLSGTSMVLLDSTNTPVPAQPDTTSGRQSSVQLTGDLTPGPYKLSETNTRARSTPPASTTIWLPARGSSPHLPTRWPISRKNIPRINSED